MNFIIVGLGSMGKRRIRLLKKLFPKNALSGVDYNKDRREEVERIFRIPAYNSIEEAMKIERPDAALICTSPLSHHLLILKCLEENLHVFTEINLYSDYYDEILDLAQRKNRKLFLSSTPLYRNEIKWIQLQVQQNSLGYCYHVGQYLPDWHPWESYTDFFVSCKETNACREIFAIELPWIIQTFGEVVDFKVSKNKFSTLEIDYPDYYSVILRHRNGSIGTFNVDLVSRKATRTLTICNEELYVTWGGTPDSLYHYNDKTKEMEFISTYQKIEHNASYAESIIENAYLDELKAFVYMIEGDASYVKYDFEKDREILQLINKIEK